MKTQQLPRQGKLRRESSQWEIGVLFQEIVSLKGNLDF